ncbi:iron-sulfur cluster biosynthesis family protein [Bacillus salacetis]|uniref:Iron-sulfur cluster biosynthesis family protein n=1 Tax=Bacillus salacetis TaxID=2315464 RepID=A0A3A1QXR9_9BACI|nr:iron-sulfur cluster biosynthesis family protein [Bacillus salacetis]RIW33591.1 iron-sulfur cluster biosynthesis family protein [Bacillus salacetis]
MNITITEEAQEILKAKIGSKKGHLKIKYETEGCGCVMSGIPVLEYVEQIGHDDIEIDTGSIPVLVEKSKQVFYDKNLKIDFSPSSKMFQLKSPGQILNGRMNFFIR